MKVYNVMLSTEESHHLPYITQDNHQIAIYLLKIVNRCYLLKIIIKMLPTEDSHSMIST